MPKHFLCLNFAVDYVISVSKYDLENKRMPPQEKD